MRLTTALFLLLSPIAFAERVTLETPQGPVIGDMDAANISVFKGIPYATPPTGNRRWRHAETVADWTSARLATRYGPHCVQNSSAGFYSSPISLMSEDCLYLNVWTPGKTGDARPVMVWIHGGSLRTGSGSTPTYDGTALARKGVIVVTINYRLGVLGYLAHPELSKESPQGASGNYGTSDQIEALAWVQRNIAAYGGDPENVTIFGESAGAWSVHHLMASPLASGKFHKAILQSGHQFSVRTSSAEQGERGRKFQEDAGAASLAELRDMSWREVQKVRGRFSAVVDGWIIPAPIYSIYSEGKQNSVPTITGFNEHEMTTLGGDRIVPKSEEEYVERARRMYGELTDKYLTVYPASDLRASALAASRDMSFGWGAQTLAKMSKENSYVYLFSHAPLDEKLGAFHAAEIAYAFNNVDDNPAFIALADTMSDYWVSFAKTGKPRVKGAPRWRAYDHDRGNYMSFATEGARAKDDLLPGTWEFFDEVNTRRRENPESFSFRR